MANELIIHGVTDVTMRKWETMKTDEGRKFKTARIIIKTEDKRDMEIVLFK